ncbi:MAG: hypothetical protein HYW23_03915 [Candidatus Aenigmarchaeota archaeon]|nr:hypothetical protein [Candidatus Aenigmarchaeota archaeon]
MKANVALVALVSIASVLTIVGVFSFSIAYQTDTVERSIKERGMIEVINQVEFIKAALHHAVDYSVYQSAYELSKYGGYDSCTVPDAGGFKTDLPYWRIRDACSTDQFKDKLSKRVNELYQLYLSAINKKLVGGNFQIPDYSPPQINVLENSLDILAQAKDKINFKSSDTGLSDNGDIKESVRIELGKLLSTGDQLFVQRDAVGDKINGAESSMSGSCRSTYQDVCGSAYAVAIPPSQECVSQFASNVKSSIKTLETETQDLKLTFSDDDIKAKYATPIKKDPAIAIGTCSCSDEGCSTLYRITFTYHYIASADIKASISGDKIYPVFDNVDQKAGLRNLELNFRVFSENK